jgi:hypothetical protein
LTLESIRDWEKNPDLYSSGVTSAIFTIMSRKYAPPAERLKSAITRERLIPRVFQSARENLKNPPRVYTEVALEQLPGIASFFRNDVPAAFRQVTDTALQADFQETNQGVLDALKAYEAYLKNDLLPRSRGDFRIGAENYRKKLLYDEMVDIPLDRLLEIGNRDLRRNQAEFERVARQIDPRRTPEQILQSLENDHPTAGKLLDAFRGTLGGLRDYIEKHGIVTIPSTAPATVEVLPWSIRNLAEFEARFSTETACREYLRPRLGLLWRWHGRLSWGGIGALAATDDCRDCIIGVYSRICGLPEVTTLRRRGFTQGWAPDAPAFQPSSSLRFPTRFYGSSGRCQGFASPRKNRAPLIPPRPSNETC